MNNLCLIFSLTFSLTGVDEIILQTIIVRNRIDVCSQIHLEHPSYCLRVSESDLYSLQEHGEEFDANVELRTKERQGPKE